MKLHLNKTKKDLLNIPEGKKVFTSLKYGEDKKRRGLNELRKHGYFKQDGRFSFIRTSKTFELTPLLKESN